MKSILNVIAVATIMLNSSVAFAAQNPETDSRVYSLVAIGDVHAALEQAMEANLARIDSKTVSLDIDTIITQAQLTNELDQYIAEAKSGLPKNRYRVVIAD